MLTALLIALIGVPDAPKAQRERADEVLLAAAKRACSSDPTTCRSALRIWATLAARSSLPPGLESEAADAVAFAKEAGSLRLFASRVGDRVRVGVADPANAVDRIDVWIGTRGGFVRLSRLEDGAQGRYEYTLAADDPRELLIDAVSTHWGEDLRLVRTVLSLTEAVVPSAPDPQTLTRNVNQNTRPVTTTKPQMKEDALPWWIIAGGVVAVGLVGAGVVQELR